MSRDENYRFAELAGNSVDELKEMERRLSREAGIAITLIAYARDGEDSESELTGSCRAGLDE